MSTGPAEGHGWDARIARARRLQRDRPAASEVLDFYARLAAFQRSLLARVHVTGAPSSVKGTGLLSEFSEAVEASRALVPDLLSWLRLEAPEALARAAEEMQRDPPEEWRRLIEERSGADERRLFVVEALLQPFAETVALRASARGAPHATGISRCPICSGPPVVGCLREQGHGARRGLVCGLCFTEWPSLRLVCLSCGERRFDCLPVFRADEGGAVRIDACDTCRVYLKTIDLTQDGDAVPVVDDLASLHLDLWAAGQSYHKLRPNLLRL